MNEEPVKLVLHVGQHKTGSKALQSFLAHHVAALRAFGILYPTERRPGHGIRAYAISQYRIFALLRREAMAACGDVEAAEAFWAGQRVFCRPFDSVREILESLDAERRRTGAGTLLLSAEDLFDMHSAHETVGSMAWVASGARILAGIVESLRYDPKVVVYLRRQDHLLGAHYVQFIKGSPTNTLDFESFAGAFAPRLRSHDILASWASAFGPDRVTVRPYEPAALPRGIVPDFFERALGFAVPAGWAPPPEDPESVNRTLGRDWVELLRMLNGRYNVGRTVFPREDVLEAALSDPDEHHPGPGIASWLSPADRRRLLDAHAEGNAGIARRFLGSTPPGLFAEPHPDDDARWSPYTGLSAERTLSIALRVHEAAGRRSLPGTIPALRRFVRLALRRNA